ncbi:MAG: DUF465 domain-containing protein [Alphaproteobacteria bacterium]|nr:DUF465 domain-containing protein [Alphaproteobacteria bacterium]
MDSEKKLLLKKIELLKQEHREIYVEISTMGKALSSDQLQVQRLKKRKLALKDEITRLESSIVPNIIA